MNCVELEICWDPWSVRAVGWNPRSVRTVSRIGSFRHRGHPLFFAARLEFFVQ